MKVLFQLPYPGYLRMYGSTVRELAARGHTVELAYDSGKRRDATAEQTEALPGVSVIGCVPGRRGRLAHVADGLRIGADYVRYLDPRYADAQGLRRRMDKFLPGYLKPLKRLRTLPGPVVRAVIAALRAADGVLPAPPQTRAYLAERAPDCVLVTPVVGRGIRATRQADTLRTARQLGMPTALAVSSWDHLTSKGLIKGNPDRVLLWNDAQRREAVELHGVPVERIVVTGAQLFDTWFARRPEVDREGFLDQVGLPPGRPYVLYVGSSPNIAPVERELAFVRRWTDALRVSGDAGLRDAAVLVRPHPGNVAGWRDADLSDMDAFAIAPRERPNIPMSDEDEALYFHSLHFSGAVVGINTSAMIEAAIVGRPVHTVRVSEFADTQDGTLHFKLLVDAGAPAVRVAEDLPAHVAQLAEALADLDKQRAHAERFVRAFVRPHGLERAATPLFADAVEALRRQRA